eukprot:2439690-Pleurochrysis_carterae.AAC.1
MQYASSINTASRTVQPIEPDLHHAAAADADDDGAADNDADAHAHAHAPATLTATLRRAGRHAATYELECIRLRQFIDAQRNTIDNLEAEIVHLDKKTVRSLGERDRVKQEAAAQQVGAAAATEEARGAYEIILRQQHATASV